MLRDLLAQLDPPVPSLERIVTVPILDPDGTVRATAGYVESARVLIDLAPDLAIPPVPERPVAADRAIALSALCE